MCIKHLLLQISIVFAGFIFLAPDTSAHLSGQPPYFKINGVYSEIYPVQAGTNTTVFTFPQDIGPTSYIVSTPIQFTLDPKTIPYPTDSLPQLTFLWDFGDGAKGTGLQNTHSYKKPGTYNLVINTKTPDSDQTFLLQDTYIHIKPTKDYKLPKPVILINGKKASDYPLEFAQVDLQKPVSLAVELPPNATITSYTWDLDDGTKQTEASFTHTFPRDRSVVTPLLRVVDKYGIIIDTGEPIVNKKLKETLQPILITSVSALIIIIALIILVILRKRRHQK